MDSAKHDFMNVDLRAAVPEFGFSTGELDEAAKARWENDVKIVTAMRQTYVDMVKDGKLVVAEGDWIAIYDGNKVKIAKTQEEVLKGITFPCYSVQHRADLKRNPRLYRRQLPSIFQHIILFLSRNCTLPKKNECAKHIGNNSKDFAASGLL